MENTFDDVIKSIHQKSIKINEKISQVMKMEKSNIKDIDVEYLNELSEHLNNAYEYITDLQLLLNVEKPENTPEERLRIKHLINVNKVQKYMVPYMSMLVLKLDNSN
jgi:t-SNARE complex subunit (syntaxin)